MDPSIGVCLEIAIFGALLYFFMYFTFAKGPIVRKVREWALEAREARNREVEKQDERTH